MWVEGNNQSQLICTVLDSGLELPPVFALKEVCLRDGVVSRNGVMVEPERIAAVQRRKWTSRLIDACSQSMTIKTAMACICEVLRATGGYEVEEDALPLREAGGRVKLVCGQSQVFQFRSNHRR
jgi:hypothetical protein